MNDRLKNRYVLMHKDIRVADIILDDNANITKVIISNGINEQHLPFKNTEITSLKDRLNEWWDYRCISFSRDGMRDRLHTLGYNDVVIPELIRKSLGFNLTDGYWCKPEGVDMKYNDFNFYDNTYSEALGEILIQGKSAANLKEQDFKSPDPCTGGHLPKQWVNRNGTNYLKKTVYSKKDGKSMEAYNEALASKIADLFEIPHVEYEIIEDKGQLFSICKTMSSKDVEFIAAENLRIKKSQNQSPYQYMVQCYKENGISEEKTVDFFNRMLAFDYLICNEDRHYNNFGLLRDTNTCETISIAPLFDNGMSLYYNNQDMSRQVFDNTYDRYECKPFKKQWEKQIKLITDLSWLNFDKIREELPRLIASEYDMAVNYGLRSEKAVNSLIRVTMARLDHLEELKMALESKNSQKFDMDL